MMATMSRTRLYRRMVESTELLDSTKRELFFVGHDCVYVGCKQLSHLIQIYGAPIVQQAYEHGAVSSAARIQYICFQYSVVAGRDTCLESLDTLVKFLTRTAPYLVYYSVFRSAMRARRQMKSFLTSEALNDAALGAYDKRFEELVSLSEFFDRNRPTICDSCQVDAFTYLHFDLCTDKNAPSVQTFTPDTDIHFFPAPAVG